jgi:hypothetical protein
MTDKDNNTSKVTEDIETDPPTTSLDDEDNPSDLPFDPSAIDDGWGEDWTVTSEKVIFDSRALKFINGMLPRIQIPTWIKRVAKPIHGPTTACPTGVLEQAAY